LLLGVGSALVQGSTARKVLKLILLPLFLLPLLLPLNAA
jgi:hypothetical protein